MWEIERFFPTGIRNSSHGTVMRGQRQEKQRPVSGEQTGRPNKEKIY